MDAKQFLAEFGHIANANGGVQRLREMVLSLAVLGKLVIQNKNESIHKNLFDSISEDINQSTYEIPKNWRIVRFKDLLNFQGGGQPPKNTFSYSAKAGYVQLIQIRDLGKYPQPVYIPKELAPKFCTEDDILIGRYGASVGKVFWGKNGAYNVALVKMEYSHSAFLPHFLYSLLNSPLGQNLFVGITRSAQSGFNKKDIAEKLIPLPPLEEQARIVEKVDELMGLCDKLEEQQRQKRKLQNHLRQATLQAVATATSPFELEQHWQRLQVNFEQLFSTPNDVEEFSAHIKELAVQGLLTLNKKYRPDITSIKAACSELKGSYISKKLMRKQKPVSIAECSVIYPKNWELQAFDEIAIVIGGVTKGRKIQGRTLVNCPYLAVANVQRGFFKLANVKTIDIPVDELEKYIVQENDLLITEGGDWDKVGRTAIWKENIENCIHQNHIFKARLPSEKVLNSWVELVFNSNVGRDYFAGASKQTTNLASINMTQLRSFPFPIPPIEQQIEILEVVESLEKICQSWRKKYKRLNELSSLLASTSVSALTGIDAPKEEESLKTPTTELIAPISLGPNKPSGNDSAPLSTILVKQNGKINANDLWQRFGGEIDAFYAQLKSEISHGWIAEPTNAEMLEKNSEQ
jgi:type I restriction enzyme S subunit